jgi:hypothetical protein
MRCGVWSDSSRRAATFIISIGLFTGFDPTETDYQFVQHVPWIADYGVHYYVGIDGISLLLVLLTTFLMPITLLASWHDIAKSLKSYVFFMLFLETGMLGAFVSLNLFQFYVFWELMLVPMYFIIGIWGGPRRIYAAVKFFLFTMVGSLLMLIAMLVIYSLFQQQTGTYTFDFVAPPGSHAPALLDTMIPVSGHLVADPVLAVRAFALAFAIKVPMVPLHTWLPDAHVEAPTAGSVVLAGVLLKMGTYGFLRFALPLFPAAIADWTPDDAHALGDRDRLRLARRDGAGGHQEAGRLLVGGAPRLRDARHVRAERAGRVGQRAADDQPRALDRRAVPARRHALRAPPHPARHRVRRRREADARVSRSSSASSRCRASACRC